MSIMQKYINGASLVFNYNKSLNANRPLLSLVGVLRIFIISVWSTSDTSSILGHTLISVLLVSFIKLTRISGLVAVIYRINKHS